MPENEADKVLIAAAPDMLAVLEKIERERYYCPICDARSTIDGHQAGCELLAVIKKARGE